MKENKYSLKISRSFFGDTTLVLSMEENVTNAVIGILEEMNVR